MMSSNRRETEREIRSYRRHEIEKEKERDRKILTDRKRQTDQLTRTSQHTNRQKERVRQTIDYSNGIKISYHDYSDQNCQVISIIRALFKYSEHFQKVLIHTLK